MDGKKLDYSFFFDAQCWGSGASTYVSASLSLAVYRQGTIVLDGKKRKIIVLDNNSNGRFDDVISMPKNISGADNELVANYGDALLIESTSPQGPQSGRLWAPPGEAIAYLAGLTVVNGKYYHFKVSPLGDELTWSPSTIARGQVTSPHAPCQVELIGDLGQISLNLEKSKPATVPAGQWRVLSYNIHVPKAAKEEPKETADKQKEAGKAAKKNGSAEKPSVIRALTEALFGLDSETTAAEDETFRRRDGFRPGNHQGRIGHRPRRRDDGAENSARPTSCASRPPPRLGWHIFRW